ncbi:MAG: hypothetical protein AAGA99_27335, partial [Actinomycetota bacterium]
RLTVIETFVAQDRHVIGAGSITLAVVWPGSDGEPADLTGNTATVSVADADGTVLATGAATIPSGTSGKATFELAAEHTSRPRWLTATWTRDDGAIRTSTHELVGGVYFTIADARTEKGGMADTGMYADNFIQEARYAAEIEAEEICGVAFVPRFARLRIDGSGWDELAVEHPRVRELISVTEDGTAWTADEVAAVIVDDAMLILDDGCVWTRGRGRFVLEYLHGWDRLPADMLVPTMRRAKHAIDNAESTVPVGAFTAAVPGGGQITLQRPDAMRTGDHTVDAVYARHNDRVPGFGA